jgi:hypothetical protein
MEKSAYKKIVNKKMYNTATAELLGDWQESNRRDFRFVLEKLYITKKGEYFLHGEGGAMTDYGVDNYDNSRSRGETIKPLTKNEAYEWAEKTEQLELIETHFKDEIDEA